MEDKFTDTEWVLMEQNEDLRAELDALKAENERIARCYESATGKPVCGEGSVYRLECRQMSNLRAELAAAQEKLRVAERLLSNAAHQMSMIDDPEEELGNLKEAICVFLTTSTAGAMTIPKILE